MNPAITPAESAREAHALSEAIDAAAKREDWEGVVDACRQALAHPCAPHAFFVADIWTGLAEAHVLRRSYEEAIDALRSAVAAGHRAWPHPDADIARLHLLAGRREEADALFASLLERTPDDVWFYHAAGLAYADVGDHEKAVDWFGKGIEAGFRTGDPEGVVARIDEARRTSLERLGRAPDELSDRAKRFVEAWVRPVPGSWSPPDWPGDLPAPQAFGGPCGHCGWTPAVLEPDEAARRSADPRLSNRAVGVAFFTVDEWPRAVARWPHLLDEMPADHLAYVREMQARIMQISEATGARLVMVPISLGGLLAHCAGEEELNPGSGEARAGYAAKLLSEGHGRAWPPGRNEACWCGSGRKYKVCCGTVERSASLRLA